MEERLYWLGFSCFHGIGPTKLQLLLDTFWNAENAWNASEQELLHSGIGQKVTERFLHFRKTFQLQRYADDLEKRNVSFLLLNEEAYPTLLTKSINPPFVLYIKGNKDIFNNAIMIAVVGTRKITDYGRHVTERLSEDLASAGCVIVSGLALGVDAFAHRSALRVEGKTVAVLGCGVDCCTPLENQRIYDDILASGGTIVSEAPLGQRSFKGSFPSRNRIIAGLSQGVVVTEGAEDSGSLITANDAFKNDRKVFAVPGPINSAVSKGPNALLHKGASIVTSAGDILDEFSIKSLKRKKDALPTGDSPEEQAIIALLAFENLAFDELGKRTGIPSSQLGSMLSLMEMKGMIRTLETGSFTLAS